MVNVPGTRGYNVRVGATGIPYVDLSATAVPVQWRLYERHTNQLTVTAREIVDDARIRHWSFADIEMGDGAAIRWLNARQRYLLLLFRDGLKGVVTVTVRTTATPNATPGFRVGLTPSGTPFLLDTPGDGYAVYLAPATQVPFIDASGVPIADTPNEEGWPLPVEVISVMAMKGVYDDGSTVPVDVRTENERSAARPGRRLSGFSSGSRIAPLTGPGAPTLSDTWQSLTHTELSYIGLARITSICCRLTVPAVLVEALVAGLAETFANQSKLCVPPERAQFTSAARRAEGQLAAAANDILGESSTRSVTFKG